MNILITGATGILGKNLLPLFEKTNNLIYFPTSKEINILNFEILKKYIYENNINLIIHCAAYTDVKKSEEEINKCIDINIIGTCNIVKACNEKKIKLIYISTEHVFDGNKGFYTTDDCINPIGKYAKSKAAGELTARMYNNSLIIRTSFFPENFPYEKAFTDQWSSKDYIDIIAPKIFKACLSNKTGIVHCVSSRRTIYEIAKERKPDVVQIKRENLNFPTLKDTSLIPDEEFDE